MRPQLLLKGDFNEEDINITVQEESSRIVVPEIESQIGELWSQTLTEAKSKGKLAYDGDLYRLEDFQIDDGKLHINVSRIKFSVVNGLKKLLEILIWEKSILQDVLQ